MFCLHAIGLGDVAATDGTVQASNQPNRHGEQYTSYRVQALHFRQNDVGNKTVTAVGVVNFVNANPTDLAAAVLAGAAHNQPLLGNKPS
jgi:hypothetical protein